MLPLTNFWTECYDPATDSWSVVGDMPSSRWSFGNSFCYSLNLSLRNHAVSHIFCPDHGWALLPWRSGRTWARTSSSRRTETMTRARTSSSRRSLQKESNYGKPTRILENVFAQSKAFVCTRSVYLCTARVSTEAKKHSSLYPTYVSDTSGYLLVYTVPRSQLLALEISLLLLLICHIVPYLLVSHIMWHIFAQEEMRYNIYHICIHLNQRNV